ncbi:MAG: hypothetical protein ACRYFA_13205 [Janthinobacterium lividum]
MKNLILLCFFVLSFNYRSSLLQKNDMNVYRNLISELGIPDDVSVHHQTSTETLLKVDFKKTMSNKWYGDGIIQGCDVFFNQIRIDTLKNTHLTSNIGKHPFTTKTNEPFVAFSPVIYSADGKMVICSVNHYSDPEAASETVYLLKLERGTWKIVRFYMVSIS